MRAGHSLLLCTAAFLTGCPPDLGGYEIIVDDVPDGGHSTANPPDLGPPCGNPHLLVGTTNSSSGARVMRWDPATQALCRTSPLLELQGAYGTEIADAAGTANLGEVLALDRAILALDEAGYPRWRYQIYDSYDFNPGWLDPIQTPSGLRLAAMWWLGGSSGDPSGILLLDTQGRQVGQVSDLPFSQELFAANPDGSASIVMSASYGPVRSYPIADSTTAITSTQGTDLFNISGRFEALASDVATHRLVIAADEGVAVWTVGSAPPASFTACPSYCSSFSDAAVDPDDASSAYGICNAPSGGRHLVHVGPGECRILIDGTTLGGRLLNNVALVRLAI